MAVLTDWENAKFRWSYSGSDATEFHLKWGLSSGDYSLGSTTLTGNSGEISVSDVFSDPGTYYVKMFAANTAGEGSSSSELDIETRIVLWLRKGN